MENAVPPPQGAGCRLRGLGRAAEVGAVGEVRGRCLERLRVAGWRRVSGTSRSRTRYSHRLQRARLRRGVSSARGSVPGIRCRGKPSLRCACVAPGRASLVRRRLPDAPASGPAPHAARRAVLRPPRPPLGCPPRRTARSAPGRGRGATHRASPPRARPGLRHRRPHGRPPDRPAPRRASLRGPRARARARRPKPL